MTRRCRPLERERHPQLRALRARLVSKSKEADSAQVWQTEAEAESREEGADGFGGLAKIIGSAYFTYNWI